MGWLALPRLRAGASGRGGAAPSSRTMDLGAVPGGREQGSCASSHGGWPVHGLAVLGLIVRLWLAWRGGPVGQSHLRGGGGIGIPTRANTSLHGKRQALSRPTARTTGIPPPVRPNELGDRAAPGGILHREPPSKAPGAAGFGMSQTILVVDDEARIVKLVRDYLERAGFGVLVARDGETALRSPGGSSQTSSFST